METGILVACSAVAGNILLGVGLAATWIRNGREQATKYGELKTQVKNVDTGVCSLKDTTKRIDEKVGQFTMHCADMSGRLDERLRSAERDIHDIKKKP